MCLYGRSPLTDGGERVDPVENQLRRGWRSSERASEKEEEEEEERGKQAALCELMQLLPSLPSSFLPLTWRRRSATYGGGADNCDSKQKGMDA